MKPTQQKIYTKLIATGWSPEKAESFSADLIDKGYFAKDLKTFAMPAIQDLRKLSTHRNRTDSGATDEDFEIAKEQAKFAMRDLPAGMGYDDLLEVGTHVIIFNRDQNGMKYHGKDLADAIKRKIVRKKQQWRRLNNITAPAGDADLAFDAERWAQRMGEQGLALAFAPRPTRAEVDQTPFDRWNKFEKILESLSPVQRRILTLVVCGQKQAQAARIVGVSQSTVSNLLSKLKRPAPQKLN